MPEIIGARSAREEALSRLLRVCGHRLYHSQPGSRAQAQVLRILREEGRTSQKELQERLQVQSGSISELITKLEQKGHLRRERDSLDRRKVMLELTEEGEARAAHMAEASRIPVHYAALSDGELADLTGLLEKVIQGWKEDGVPEGELRAPELRA